MLWLRPLLSATPRKDPAIVANNTKTNLSQFFVSRGTLTARNLSLSINWPKFFVLFCSHGLLFCSQSAQKRRFLHVPPLSKIQFFFCLLLCTFGHSCFGPSSHSSFSVQKMASLSPKFVRFNLRFCQAKREHQKNNCPTIFLVLKELRSYLNICHHSLDAT